MANLATNLLIHKPSFALLENDQDMELLSHFPVLNPIFHRDLNLNFQSIMGYSIDNFTDCQMLELPGKSWDYSSPLPSDVADQVSTVINGTGFDGNSKKRKTEDLTDSCSRNSSSPPVSYNATITTKNVSGRGKRGRSKEKKTEEEKPKEVVHVRAKRGQATDSHSLAERVRRGKINDKFRFLQDMVPGCYKEMGMAVKLDEIINYVQSLQNQVEFLSLKLAAASAVHDFNTQTGFLDNVQKTKAFEAQDMDSLLSTQEGEGYNDQVEAALACIRSTWPLI